MRTYHLLGLLLLTLLIGGCSRAPSLAERIEATAAKVDPRSSTIPKDYEQEMIALAKEPTPALREAFRTLDAKRSAERYGRPGNDRVWLTGTLITILAFDVPPITARDDETYDKLKSRLYPPQDIPAVFSVFEPLERSEANDKLLADWPWSHTGSSWRLLSIAFTNWGTSDGEISPRFEYYESQFKRRQLK